MIKRGYIDHKSRAKRRGIAFNLTFDQWLSIWIDSGKLHLRGRGAGKYCMSRIGDAGPYEIGNVFIQSFEGNSSDGHKGRKQDESWKEKRAESLKGKPSGMLGKIAWNKGIKGSTHKKHEETV
jgi:hypothetical protein